MICYSAITDSVIAGGETVEFSRDDLVEAKRRVEAFKIANSLIENELRKR